MNTRVTQMKIKSATSKAELEIVTGFILRFIRAHLVSRGYSSLFIIQPAPHLVPRHDLPQLRLVPFAPLPDLVGHPAAPAVEPASRRDIDRVQHVALDRLEIPFFPDVPLARERTRAAPRCRDASR